MPIETLEQELKNPRLQAALASAWWSEEEAELILSALERSGLTVREFAKRQVGAARLYSRRQQLRKKNAQPKGVEVAARRKESEPKEASPRAAQPPTELPPQFVQLTVQPTRAESESPPPPAPILASSPSPLPLATPPSNARPLGLKVRFCRPARESPESVETLELELLFPTW